MIKDDDFGVWVRANKTFYYLETGGHLANNPLDRIMKSLIQRGIITLEPVPSSIRTEPYKYMTLAEAKENEFKTEPVYLSPHIKKVLEQEKVEQSELEPWE